MNNNVPNPTQENEPFIPPQYMLVLAAVGLIVAFIVYRTQPTFNVVGWGGLGFAVLSLVAWVLMAPGQARAVLSGRTARFGGTSLIVTVVFIGALIAVYSFVRSREIRIDLTERNEFSLTDQGRQAISGMAIDPDLPPIEIIAFYSAGQAGRRDQDTVLLDDYATTSGGKISYRFVDPDRDPVTAQLYEVTRAGTLSVVALDETGEPDIENAEQVSFFNQDQLTNAILRVSASGDFRAYFLNVQDGLQITPSADGTSDASMSVLEGVLSTQYDWKTQQVSFFDLTSPESEITLNDPAADGEVLVIPGGSTPLTEEELAFVQNYVNNGGDLIIFAAPSINEDNQSLASDAALNTWLRDSFGLSFENNVVIDQTQALQTPLVPVATDFDAGNYVTANFVSGQQGMVFEIPHSITVAETAPANVTVYQLARSSATAYAKADVNQILTDTNAVAKAEGDPEGPFVLAAAAENTQTGARIVMFGSSSIPVDGYASGNGIVNLETAFNSFVWATDFNQFVTGITVLSEQRPQDTPIFADEQSLRNISFATVILIPFGILAIGIAVWWSNRERAR